ncbi:MAG: hypothetical protein MJ247_01255 [Alphaproteobacteria bacterium]|nr:hypothetical protein [Alphaproteobacteria bacterium]
MDDNQLNSLLDSWTVPQTPSLSDKIMLQILSEQKFCFVFWKVVTVLSIVLFLGGFFGFDMQITDNNTEEYFNSMFNDYIVF